MAEMLAVLPHCIGAKSVEEEEIGFGRIVSLGDPTVHDGGVAEICRH